MLRSLGVVDSSELATHWRNWLDVDRGIAHAIGLETTEWIDLGRYTTPSGRVVDITADLQAAMASTDSVPPDQQMAPPRARDIVTSVDVANETSLNAAARLLVEGYDPLVLNMANGISPGGGFLSGARAQEEYLCRTTALWATIRDDEMYPTHAMRDDFESSDWMIVSPQVPVLRDDEGTALEEPWHVSFITSAAPVARRVGAERSAMLMERRIERLFAVAADQGYRAMVLGAWGCGAFGNDPWATAQSFRSALTGPYSGVFDRIAFAITDWSDDRQFLRPFAETFTD
jgi:uncharacterized protein (TIGR02452 family)